MSPSNAIFIDIETTGLDLVNDHLLEVGIVVTNSDFAIIDQHDWLVCDAQTAHDIEHGKISDFICDFHGPDKTDLLARVAQAHRLRWSRVQPGAVEQRMIDFVTPYMTDGKQPLYGSSVHFDKYFLERRMKAFCKLFNHRVVDSSSDLENLHLTHPKLKVAIDKQLEAFKVGDHTVLNDLRDSIYARRLLQQCQNEGYLRIKEVK